MDIEQRRKIQNSIFFSILGALLLYYVVFKLEPTVISTAPATSTEISAFYEPVSFSFNKPIISERIDILVSPPIQGKLVWNFIRTNVSFIPIKPWHTATTYTASLTAIIENKSQLLAQTAFTEMDNGTDSEVTEARDEYAAANYPLLSSTPWNNDLFSLDYTGPNSLEIRVHSLAKRNEIVKKINEWIISKKVDPKTHYLKWTLVSGAP